jgi:hypothetical protein
VEGTSSGTCYMASFSIRLIVTSVLGVLLPDCELVINTAHCPSVWGPYAVKSVNADIA